MLTDPESALLLQIIRHEKPTLEAVSDWDAVFRLAAQHRITPLVYVALKPHAAAVAAAAWAKVSAHIDTLKQRNLHMAMEIRHVLTLMHAANIPTIPYKGLVLAQTAYASLFAREVRDLDFIVPTIQAAAARDLLIQDGYHWLKSAAAHDILHHDERGTHLELHWTLSADTQPAWMASLWRETQPDTFMHTPAVKFNPSDLVFTLFLHGSRHLWSDLIWLCDLDALIRTQPFDWARIWERGEQFNMTRFIAVGVLMLHAVIYPPLPADVIARAESDRTAQTIAAALCRDFFESAPHRGLISPGFWRRLRLRQGWRDRFGYLRYHLSLWQPLRAK